jgi:hypothetical protein
MRIVPRLLALAGLFAVATVPLAAQGGGGGMGGGQRLGQMASLEQPMAGVEGVTDAQKTSLTAIETKYRKELTEAAMSMRDLMMAARESGSPPDMNEMRKVREAMRAMREKELAEVRGVLTDAQRPKFDANVKAMLEAEAKREAEMRARMGGAPPV